MLYTSILTLIISIVYISLSQWNYVKASGDIQTAGEQTYTFVPTSCDFLDLTQLPLTSQAPEELGFRCGYVIVPEEHAAPDSPTIHLPVAILSSNGPNPKGDPLFVAQGGPGGSAFEIFPYSLPGTAIAAERDIVMFNQRGTLAASPELFCSETIEGIAELVSLPYDEATALSIALMRDCYHRLETEGINFSAFNSLENANDVDAIRQALGYEDYNFYGVSYGTLLGFHLMRSQPEGLRTVILDGVLPPDQNFILEIPQNENRIYDELFQFCLSDPVCRAGYPDLEKRVFDLVERLNDDPVHIRLVDPDTGQVARAQLDGKGLMDFLFQFFYIEDSYALFPYLIAAVENGNNLVIESLWSLIAYDRSFSEGMYYSVICAEDADFEPEMVPLEGVREQIVRGAKDDLQTYLDVCEFWNVDPLPPSVDDPVYSSIPTLLLSGQYDPVTPPSFAAQAAESLTNAFNVVDPVGSHGVAFSDDCMNAVIQEFLNDPGNAPDTTCLSSPERVGELVPVDAVTVPMLAPLAQLDEGFLLQVSLAGFLLLIVLSAFFIWPLVWLIDRVRHVDRDMSHQQKGLRIIGRGLVLLFGFLGVVFGVGIITYIAITLIYQPTYLSVYAIPGSARPFLFIPYILLFMVVAMLFITLALWRKHVGTLWERAYYSILVLCAAGYISILGYHGFLSI